MKAPQKLKFDVTHPKVTGVTSAPGVRKTITLPQGVNRVQRPVHNSLKKR